MTLPVSPNPTCSPREREEVEIFIRGYCILSNLPSFLPLLSPANSFHESVTFAEQEKL